MAKLSRSLRSSGGQDGTPKMSRMEEERLIQQELAEDKPPGLHLNPPKDRKAS